MIFGTLMHRLPAWLICGGAADAGLRWSYSWARILGAAYRFQKLHIVERLDEEGESACLHDGGFRGMIFMAGNENQPGPRRFRAKVGQQFHSRHPFHPNIQHREGNGMVGEMFQKSLRFTEGIHLVAGGFEQAGDGFAHR